MINLTANVSQANITKWSVKKFDPELGTVTLQFESSAGQRIRIDCFLSNEVNKSSGAKINAAPDGWNDRIVSSMYGLGPIANGGVGAAGSLDAARNAYQGAANHNAGLKAVELRALTDGWVEAALTGT